MVLECTGLIEDENVRSDGDAELPCHSLRVRVRQIWIRQPPVGRPLLHVVQRLADVAVSEIGGCIAAGLLGLIATTLTPLSR